MIYLSSTVRAHREYPNEYGIMFSAIYPIGGQMQALESGVVWMMDNNAFNDKFDTAKWVSALVKYQKYQDSCVGIPVKDKVGDSTETLELFFQYRRIVKDLGYKVALVTQDGLGSSMVPWDLVDTLFIGGTDKHKLGEEGNSLIIEGKRRRKWIHVGRVNSPTRIKRFWIADSVDGTELTQVRGRVGGMSREQRYIESARFISFAVQFCNDKVRIANAS